MQTISLIEILWFQTLFIWVKLHRNNFLHRGRMNVHCSRLEQSISQPSKTKSCFRVNYYVGWIIWERTADFTNFSYGGLIKLYHICGIMLIGYNWLSSLTRWGAVAIRYADTTGTGGNEENKGTGMFWNSISDLHILLSEHDSIDTAVRSCTFNNKSTNTVQ